MVAFLVSASLGALIGIERQWERQHRHGDEGSGGMRTFVLWAILGCASALIARETTPVFFAVAFAVQAAILIIRPFDRSTGDAESPGLTTTGAALLTFLMGGLVLWGHHQTAAILTAVVVILLASKDRLHALSTRFTEEDVNSALVFLAITGVVLPLAPNQDFGPYGAFNPFNIWLMVVLVTGLGFFGYVAMRVFGPNAGLATMGILGGLASSTVTTIAASRQSRDRPELSDRFAMAIVLACTIMFGRVAVLVAALNRAVFDAVLPGLLAMCVPGVIYSGWCLLSGSRGAEHRGGAPVIANPLSLKVGLKFAALYAVVILLSRAGADRFGAAGVQIVSFISGLTDMDAIALSLTRNAGPDGLPVALAAQGILIGAISNTLLKGAFALTSGAPALRRPILVVFGATILIGGVWCWGR
jgi:uncharacterized membrane protein (DUF4010 family)